MQWPDDSMKHVMAGRYQETSNGQKIAWNMQWPEESMEHEMVRRKH